MHRYKAGPMPDKDRKYKREIFKETIEEALEEGLAYWKEYGKPEPRHMGLICMDTGVTLDRTKCEITGNVQVIKGRATDPNDITAWEEIPSPMSTPHIKAFSIMPTPDNMEGMTEILVSSLEESMDVLLGLWEGREKPEYMRALDPIEMVTLDYQPRSEGDGGDRRFYGLFRRKKESLKWQPDNKKNDKHGYDNPTHKELAGEVA